MIRLLLIPMVLMFALNAILIRVFQLRYRDSEERIWQFQALTCLFSAIAFYIIAGRPELPQLPTLHFGIAFGVVFFINCAANARCLEIGPMSLTEIILNMSLILPLLYSVFRLGAAFLPHHYVGTALIIATFVLAGLNREESGHSSLRWGILAFITFFTNGITAILQTEYEHFSLSDQGMLFMAIAYLTSAILFALFHLPRRSKVEHYTPTRFVGMTALACACGLGSFAGQAILLILCTRIEGPILYPCLNGGLCIVVAAVSFLCFKEKISLFKALSMVCGIASIIILNL